MYSVYIHKCPNNKVYVGITSKPVNERWKNGKGYSNNKHFMQAIIKYGWDNIEHIVIADNLNKVDACKLEQTLIKQYNSNNREYGYNKSIGGELSSLGFHHTDEAKKKISIASSKQKRSKEAYEKTARAKRKAVEVYDINANLLGVFKSLTDAEKFTGVNNSNISAVCKGKYTQFKGYIFKYADDNKEIKQNRKRKKPVAMLDLQGNVLQQFESIKEAARQTNLIDTHIIDCCKGKYTQSGGYIWKYI